MTNPNVDFEFLDTEPVLSNENNNACPPTRDYRRKAWLKDGRKFTVSWRVSQGQDGKEGRCIAKASVQQLEHDRESCKRLAIALLKGESPVALVYTGTSREVPEEGDAHPPRACSVRHTLATIGGVPVYLAYDWPGGNGVLDVCKEVFDGDTRQFIVPYGCDEPPPTSSWEWHPWHGHLDEADYIDKAMDLIQKTHFPYMFKPDKFGVLGPRPRFNCKCCPAPYKPSVWYYCGVYVTTVVEQLFSVSVPGKTKKVAVGTKKAMARRLVLFTMSLWEHRYYDEVFTRDGKEVPYCARKAINQHIWKG
jgi:hypothetical protein